MTPHVDPARLDASSGEERRVALAHAAGCRSCRLAIAAHDPALLFALLSTTPVPERILEAVSAGTARRLVESSRARPMRAVAAAMAVVALVSGAAILRSRFEPAPAFASVPRADVEVQSGGSVSQVVDFTVGNTQVVMVYNPELEL